MSLVIVTINDYGITYREIWIVKIGIPFPCISIDIAIIISKLPDLLIESDPFNPTSCLSLNIRCLDHKI